MKKLALIVLLLALPACTALAPAGMVVANPVRDWRRVATESDHKRLRDWRQAFVKGLEQARAAGHSAEIAREGVLLDPDAALGGGPIPNGMYRCRVIKLGSKAQGMPGYVAYPGFACQIQPAADLQNFAKLTGSQRHVGLLFPGGAMRQVFLGTLVLGDESRAMQYGHDEERNVTGYVERIGPRRWRMIMPNPHFESQMDVLELVPAS